MLSPSQNRSRERRIYQLESTSRKPRTDSHAVADASLGDDQVATPKDRARHEEPAHGVGAVAVEYLGDARVVVQRLAHLPAVVAQDDAVADAGGERRPVEEGGCQHVHEVEPATCLLYTSPSPRD